MTAVQPLALELQPTWSRIGVVGPDTGSEPWGGATALPWRSRLRSRSPRRPCPTARTHAIAEGVFLAALRALGQALEAKDPDTWGHSTRVGALGAAIASDLGLSEGERADIRLGGELHDVGKIGVPDDLLHKAGPLTPMEYLRVMQHPLIGERILAPLIHHRPAVLQIVRSHHEWFDGRGLPDGLAGEAIPLSVRVIAVADAYDAMTSPRPYRASLPLATATRELEDNAGSQFDPDCVRALERALPGTGHPRRQVLRRPVLPFGRAAASRLA